MWEIPWLAEDLLASQKKKTDPWSLVNPIREGNKRLESEEISCLSVNPNNAGNRDNTD